MESEAVYIKDIVGVMPYVAPELLSGRGSYSQATDVYAFGIIMWEMSLHKNFFMNLNMISSWPYESVKVVVQKSQKLLHPFIKI